MTVWMVPWAEQPKGYAFQTAQGAADFHMQKATRTENRIRVFAGPYTVLVDSDYSVYSGKKKFFLIKTKLAQGYISPLYNKCIDR